MPRSAEFSLPTRPLVVMAGGGTGGSVAPLLAVADVLRRTRPDVEILFVGTANGPEGEWVRRAGLRFTSIPAGKLRRYPSARLPIDILNVVRGLALSWRLLRRERPAVILSAGGYVAVPLVWAGWLLGIPAVIHQQDVQVGFANRLMQPFARQISVTFELSLSNFPKQKTSRIGNPSRLSPTQGNADQARRAFSLESTAPIILCLGGGTGALSLNNVIATAARELLDRVQIVHQTGRGKSLLNIQHPHYHQVEFVYDGLTDLFSAADLVVSRAGLSTLTELALFGKPSVLIPLPRTHQEANAKFFADQSAAIVLPQQSLTGHQLAIAIQSLLSDEPRRKMLAMNINRLAIPDAAQKLSTLTLQVGQLQ